MKVAEKRIISSDNAEDKKNKPVGDGHDGIGLTGMDSLEWKHHCSGSTTILLVVQRMKLSNFQVYDYISILANLSKLTKFTLYLALTYHSANFEKIDSRNADERDVD